MLAVIDELDLIDGLLRSVPDLTLAHRLVYSTEADAIHGWLDALSSRRSELADAPQAELTDVIGASDAVVEVVRWRLRRLRDLFSSLTPPTTTRAGHGERQP